MACRLLGFQRPICTHSVGVGTVKQRRPQSSPSQESCSESASAPSVAPAPMLEESTSFFEEGSFFEDLNHEASHAGPPPTDNGEPLEPYIRGWMALVLDANFDEVRIHQGATAQNRTDARGARAFADGDALHFGAGQFAPESTQSQQLLAHELTHTKQHTQGQLNQPANDDAVAGDQSPVDQQATQAEAPSTSEAALLAAIGQ